MRAAELQCSSEPADRQGGADVDLAGRRMAIAQGSGVARRGQRCDDSDSSGVDETAAARRWTWPAAAAIGRAAVAERQRGSGVTLAATTTAALARQRRRRDNDNDTVNGAEQLRGDVLSDRSLLDEGCDSTKFDDVMDSNEL
ncbi:hypothetical protein Scep_018396 [Stephania cephalantha]|uniref:Uncharacterized protein n=1 Tax=Stephania cephalantha TaxID=152367 RepID=A0AAP0I924_9MAGN